MSLTLNETDTAKKQPLVSIIIRSMGRDTVVRTLESIFLQTWLNIEIILVNAKGGEHPCLPENRSNCPFILVNQGGMPLLRSAAANAGLAACRGEYIGFLDDDDTIDPEHIYHLIEALQSNPQAGLAYAGVRGIDKENQVVCVFKDPELTFEKLLLRNVIPIHSTIFRSCLLENGACFDETLDLYEDWDFWLQLLRNRSAVFVDRVSATYYTGGNSDVSPLANNPEIVKAAEMAVFTKWLQIITASEFGAVSSLYYNVSDKSIRTQWQLDKALHDIVVAEQAQNSLQHEHALLKAEHDRLRYEAGILQGSFDNLQHEWNNLQGRYELLQDSAEHLQYELNDRQDKYNSLQHESEQLKQEFRQLNDELQKANNIIQTQQIAYEAHLAILYASRSWRITAPLRSLGKYARTKPLLVNFVQLSRKALNIYQKDGAIELYKRSIRRLTAPKHIKTPENKDYMTWLAKHDSVNYTDELKQQIKNPLISVVMPVYNPEPAWLAEAIDSVQAQTYSNWELCIADDASTNPAVRRLLEQYSSKNPGIKIIFRPENGHISVASNSALSLATGDFVCFLDHDDLLHPDALMEMAYAISINNEADILYTDEDKITVDGIRCLPFLKPDWSPHLAISQSYLGHLVCYRRQLIDKLGGLRTGMEGAQDYDLWLRASLEARAIIHIPRILYHWRLHQGSTAMVADSKPYAHEVGRRAVEAYLQKRYPGQISAAVDGVALFTYAAIFKLPPALLISIIIPTRNGLHLLRPCIESIIKRSDWQQFEIIIIDNGSDDVETLEYMSYLSASEQRVRIIRADIEFNWSKLNNIGVSEATGDCLIFLNNDTQVIASDWLQQLAGYALLPDVGLVGGLLLFEDSTIQHSGVIVGMGGWADHPFRTMTAAHTGAGPFVSPVLTRNVLTVTGACMAIERKKFKLLGGFDEAFIICGSDVELGLRAYRHGYWNVNCAEARLYHFESKTRTPYIPEEDFKQSAEKYEPYRTLQTDPFYNPNLSCSTTIPSLKE